MPVLRQFNDTKRWLFYCPGCKTHMWFETDRWTWDGNIEKPNVHPSILWTGACGTTIEPGGAEKRCHLFVENGHLRFLKDCTHEFAGKTIPMEEIDW